jgi:putative ABC transport system permease protein
LDALGVPLLRGEPLPAEFDLASGATIPVLINERSARRFWPGQEAIGRVIRANRGGLQMRIAGVVGDVRQRGLAAEPPPAMYLPQALGLRIVNTFVVRSAGDAAALVAPIRRVIQELDPNQPIRSITTLGGVMSESIAQDRFFTILFALFGGLALALATVGVYGVIAHSVSQRSQEIGVRIALGARAADILRMVVGGGMRLVLAGVVIGGLSALVLGRILESQLHGVSATDPLAFTAAVGVLVAVAALACYLPARRATRVDPILALREE